MAVNWRRDSDDVSDVEGDHMQLKIAQKQEEHLIPLKEDLADWLNQTLGVDDITADNFLSRLDNGVVVCKLARLIQQRAEECRRAGLFHGHVPYMNFKCWENAKSESFYARDNTENFLKWCRKFGVHEAVIFESDGLVLHTQQRTVVLCLLELGRIASKFGIEPPGLVQLEKEIEEEYGSDDTASSTCSSSPVLLVRSRTESSMSANSLSPRVSPPIRNGSATKRYTPSELDKKVMNITDNVCKDRSQVRRVSEGRYTIAGKTVYVRLLKGRHVMVRVGGGWDTLEHYLARHEPCHVVLVNRRTSLTEDQGRKVPTTPHNGSAESFLQIRAKYKRPVSARFSNY